MNVLLYKYKSGFRPDFSNDLCVQILFYLDGRDGWGNRYCYDIDRSLEELWHTGKKIFSEKNDMSSLQKISKWMVWVYPVK